MAKKVLIAGAGMGGLTAASCLLKAGYDVEIYEQAPALGEVGAGIQMSANAMHVLHDLGLAEEIARLAVKPGAYVFRAFDTGEEISRFNLAADHEKLHGAPYCQMHRADFHDILARKAESLKPGVVRLNHTVAGFEEDENGVTLRFTNGAEARGDVLVGADGVKSAVRRQIAGDAPATYTGDCAWRITLPVEDLPKDFLPQVMSVFMGPGAHVVCYFLRAGRLLNFVGLVETDDVSEESWTAKFPWEKLKADFVGWNEKIQTIIETVDHDKCFRWSLHYRPPIDNWSTARATMLGDAVHATLPYLAQGACMAIEDGAVLTRALGLTDDVTEALQIYQRNRMERTARIVRQSDATRTLFHMPSMEAIRARFARVDEGADRNRWLYSYNPLTVPLI
jgi:salicylate hydroxylase